MRPFNNQELFNTHEFLMRSHNNWLPINLGNTLNSNMSVAPTRRSYIGYDEAMQLDYSTAIHNHFSVVDADSLSPAIINNLSLSNLDLNERMMEQLKRLDNYQGTSSVLATLENYLEDLNIFNPLELTLYRAVDNYTLFQTQELIYSNQKDLDANLESMSETFNNIISCLTNIIN